MISIYVKMPRGAGKPAKSDHDWCNLCEICKSEIWNSWLWKSQMARSENWQFQTLIYVALPSVIVKPARTGPGLMEYSTTCQKQEEVY